MFSFIKYISVALIYNNEFKKKYDLKIFIFNEYIILKLKKIIFNFYLMIINIFIHKKKRIHGFSPSGKNFINENSEYKKYFHLFHNEKEYFRFNPDLILPLQVKIRSTILSVGYIYDFQHIDLPKLFDSREKKNRESQFKNILELNKYVIVNSDFVKKGLIKNYKIKNKRIIQLPFLPYDFDKFFFTNKNVKEKYQINNDYFIICNSFWKHKNHEVVFEAFKKFLKINQNYQLICTGSITDTRFPKYFDRLIKKFKNIIKNDKIKILGVIPRSDQLSLIKSSVAVIQPTLYEGGPGGFAAYEALSCGKDLLLSKIKVNKEIVSKNVYFFSPKSSKKLCNLLLKISKMKKNNFTKKKIEEISLNNQKKLGDYLLKVMGKILK